MIRIPHVPAEVETSNLQKLSLHMIIDCAHFEPNFYHELISNKMITIASLFKNTVQELEGLEASPLLVKFDLEKDKALIQQIMEIETQHEAVMWFWSDQSFRSLSTLLPKLLFAEREGGQKILLRYYDPRCLKGLLELFRQDHYTNDIIKHIPAWAYYQKDHYHTLLSHPKKEGENNHGHT